MEEKKQIDRLFQEKLKDFEVFPEGHVWENIEQRLTKKKRRRIVPLWLRYGSAAAVLLLLVSTGFWFFDQEDAVPNLNNTVPAVNNEKVLQPDDQQESEEVINNTEISTTDIDDQENTATDAVANKTQQTTTNTVSNKEREAVINQKVKQENSLAIIDQAKEKEAVKTTAETDQKIAFQNEGKLNELENTEKDVLVENTAANQSDLQLTKGDIANAIEDQLDENNAADFQQKKWSVGTTIAPVYFNSLNGGSPINASLVNNSKETNASLSYGVKVNYHINDRLSLQSGINSVELAYKTQGVTALITSSEVPQLSSTNIDTNISGISLIAISNNQIASQSSELNSQRGVLNLRGDLNQSMSYIEIPVEAKYALLNKKFGVHLVGGLSTYVLYKNQVSLLDQNGSTTLGEASNINDINFSGNLGLDFDYELGKKLFINVSPMFKYQMNTFSKNDGGFKPYYLGVYTGLNFRF